MTSPPPASGLIRLATASPATQPTTAATLAQLRRIARRAADAHAADILLLPEAYVGGYPRGSAFGAVVGSRSAAGRDEFLRYFEAAVDLGDVVGEGCAGGGDAWVARRLGGDEDGGDEGDGGGDDDEDGRGREESGRTTRRSRRGDGTREAIEAVAAETGVFLVVGCIEKVGGSLYCAAVYVCPRRGMIGKRRKVMPTGTERLIWAQGSPRTLQAVSTVIRGTRVNMAAAICWESYMPLLRQALYAQNVNLYLMPTADGRDSWLALARTVGLEGRCFVVSANMCVRSGPSSSSSSSSGSGSAVVDGEADAPPYGSERPRAARRSSAITEDGFEIALPPARPQQGRRRSVLDEDGNEIVLPRGARGEATTATGDKTKTNGQVATATTFVSRGGSCITSPSGDVLAGPQWEDDEGIIFADVDFKDCIRGRLDYDAGGSYSRSDSFKFSVEGLSLTPLPY